MKKLKYKGYIGNIEQSQDNDYFFGQVLGLNKKTCITYEGKTLEELQKDFKEGIEHYLEYCKIENIIPERPRYEALNINIPTEIHYKIITYVKNHGISIEDFVCDSLKKRLEYV